MEILFAYALLLCEGYDVWEEYSEKLDRLFLADPENDMYLYLETTTDMRQAVMHILSETDNLNLDYEIFGRTLMELIRKNCPKSDLEGFAEHMSSLWTYLPYEINEEKPFYFLGYAVDYLSYDEKQCREMLEKAINYYTK